MNNPPGPDFIRIAEAARMMGVTTRTVYRRIWGGELPAAKFGGLYFIRRGDLETLLQQGNNRSKDASVEAQTNSAPLKCGSCYRLIIADSQIGGVCECEGCEDLICVQCQAEGIHFCARHAPTHEQKWQLAAQRLQRNEIALLVKASTARLREVNFSNRIQQRLARIATLIHPTSGEILNLPAWGTVLNSTDQRAEVMRLMGKVMLDADTLAQVPLNAGVQYTFPAQKGQKGPVLEVRVQVLNHLAAMVEDGFDTKPFTLEELLPWLVRVSEQSQRSQTFMLVVLAAGTGWDSAAQNAIQGSSSRTTGALPFSHRFMLAYLYDLERNELIYNQADENAHRYAELFVPRLSSEELAEVVKAVESQLVVYESLTLQYATEILPYPKTLIQQAFDKLVATGRYTLLDTPALGITLIRK